MDVKFISGHESFYLRDGWIRKGILAVNNDKYVFKKSNLIKSIDSLGIGSNMVNSLKYWLEFTQMVVKNRKEFSHTVSEMGNFILKNDSYLQNENTLWLIHCLMAKKSPIWQMIYQEVDFYVFDKDILFERILNRFKEEGIQYSPNTIKSAINVFINTYVWDRSVQDPENNIKSPLARLKIIAQIDKKKYKFRQIDQSEISPFFLLYLFSNKIKDQKIQIAEALMAVRDYIYLDMNNFRQAIKYLEHNQLISIDRAAGLNNIIIKEHLDSKALLNKSLTTE